MEEDETYSISFQSDQAIAVLPTIGQITVLDNDRKCKIEVKAVDCVVMAIIDTYLRV